MNRRNVLAVSFALAITGSAAAQLPAASAAQTAAAKAAADAAPSNRRLLLVFYASWCVYCRLFDRLLQDHDAGPIIDRHLAVLHMRAGERKPEMQAQQLAGADEVYASFTSANSGFPYLVVLDAKGKKVTDSIMADGMNFGFPAKPDELDGFAKMMKAAAPSITDAEQKALRRVCVNLMKMKT